MVTNIEDINDNVLESMVNDVTYDEALIEIIKAQSLTIDLLSQRVTALVEQVRLDNAISYKVGQELTALSTRVYELEGNGSS